MRVQADEPPLDEAHVGRSSKAPSSHLSSNLRIKSNSTASSEQDDPFVRRLGRRLPQLSSRGRGGGAVATPLDLAIELIGVGSGFLAAARTRQRVCS